MPNSDLEVRYLIASHDLDDYDVLSTPTLSVAIPYKTTESLRKLIWAAIVTYVFGNSSVDHVVRRYGHLWDKRTDKSFESDPRVLTLRRTYEDVSAIADRLQKVEVTGSLGQVCAKSALCRLEATFKAAYGLIRRDYVFETEAVVRMLLEQLAWAHEAFRTPESHLGDLNPTKCITPFKTFFRNAGKFYGELSEGAHLDPLIINHYLRFHREGTEVVRRSQSDSQRSGYYFTALASVYLKLVQQLFAPFTESEIETLGERLHQGHQTYCQLMNGDTTVTSPLAQVDVPSL
jgi:hypothetical protein